MQKLSRHIADILAEGNVILPADIERCRYGIEVMFSSLGELLCVLVISLFAKNFVETLIFLTAFIPLRLYAGGYHADTRLRCFAILLGVYIFFTIFTLIVDVKMYNYIIVGGTVFTLVIVFWKAPILHSRKNLTQNEIIVFRRISIKICVFETLFVFISSFMFTMNIYLLSFVCGLLAVSLSMTAACIKQSLKKGGTI